ncbi:MAG: hypothetical protein PHD64_10070, partial [Mesotoga sp.]|nr:hypothetical protein [Mesotoga sp.]
ELEKEVLVKKAEDQTKQDETILAKKDEELMADEKTRKLEILKSKKPESKTKEEKMELRIHELVDKMDKLEKSGTATKAELDAAKADSEKAKKELADLKKSLSMTSEDKIKSKVKDEVKKLRETYLSEDKEKPREERREMTKDELDEWRMEDVDAANEWSVRRSLRRVEEERRVFSDEVMTHKATEILDKQEESQKRVFTKHPELDNDKRKDELLKQGKSKEEVLKILCDENPKYKACLDILNENREKYMLSPDGPELIATEMEKRLGKETPKASTEEIEKLKAEVERLKAEKEELEGLDTSHGSTRHGNPPPSDETELDKKQVELAKKVKLDPSKLKARVKYRKEQGFDD